MVPFKRKRSKNPIKVPLVKTDHDHLFAYIFPALSTVASTYQVFKKMFWNEGSKQRIKARGYGTKSTVM